MNMTDVIESAAHAVEQWADDTGRTEHETSEMDPTNPALPYLTRARRRLSEVAADLAAAADAYAEHRAPA